MADDGGGGGEVLRGEGVPGWVVDGRVVVGGIQAEDSNHEGEATSPAIYHGLWLWAALRRRMVSVAAEKRQQGRSAGTLTMGGQREAGVCLGQSGLACVGLFALGYPHSAPHPASARGFTKRHFACRLLVQAGAGWCSRCRRVQARADDRMPGANAVYGV